MTRQARDERGAVVVIAALSMVALLIMAAIVIDLGATRALRSGARATADAAATAGANDLETSGAAACMTAFAYAFTNLGATPPASIDATCASAMPGTCTSGTARVATVTAGGTMVKVTNPVPDGDALLRATAVGGGVTQVADATADGLECRRLAVEITQSQASFFRGVTSSRSGTFSVHSVARYQPTAPGGPLPALVALDQRACKAVDTGNGSVWVKSTTIGPGIVYSDSDGSSPACSGSDGILHVGSSGSLRAAASSASVPGQLAWFSASSHGSTAGRSNVVNGTTGTNADYVGQLLALSARTTRAPVDATYHCTNVNPLCTAADPVKDADALAQASAAPTGFATSTLCGTASGLVTFSVSTFVSCATPFEVRNNPLVVTGGVTVIFKNGLVVTAGGTLAVNVTSASNPTLDANGLPVAAFPAAQTRLIVGSTAAKAVDLSATSAAVYTAQTFLYSRGGFSLTSGTQVRWTAPSAGVTKGLLYWSESSSPFDLQGSPVIKADGVVFQGNGALTAGGSGQFDLTNVQTWVARVALSGSPQVLLAPDPSNAIAVGGTGSALIR